MLTDWELERYSRQITVSGFDFDGQQALADARVLLVGCGGLGNPIALYLVAAGVGELHLVDDDTIELSNLPRQVVFGEADIGRSKVAVLAAALRERNPQSCVIEHSQRFSDSNASALINDISVVVDATDNRATRALIDRETARQGIPWIMGAAVQMVGQNMIFDGPRAHGCYHCLAPDSTRGSGSCAELGILGPVVGAVAMTQAMDALKLLTGCGTLPWGILRLRDFRTDELHNLTLAKRENCPVCGG